MAKSIITIEDVPAEGPDAPARIKVHVEFDPPISDKEDAEDQLTGSKFMTMAVMQFINEASSAEEGEEAPGENNGTCTSPDGCCGGDCGNAAAPAAA